MKTCIFIILLNAAYLMWHAETRNVYVAAPNTLRLSAEENIAIAMDGVGNRELMHVYVQDYPGRKKNLTFGYVTLSPGKPEIASFTIEPRDLNGITLPDPKKTFYTCLVIHGNGFHKEAIIPLSMQSGYVYIQTDKPIYTPKQKVEFRVIHLNEAGRPAHGKIRMQIRNPKNVVVRDTAYGDKDSQLSSLFIIPHPFEFAPYPLLGHWSATVLYGHNFQQNSTVEFEVQEYVLPTFTVKLTALEVILPSTTVIPVTVEAKYLYGKPVIGIVTFRLGIKGETPNAVFFGVVDSKELVDGEYSLNVNVDDLKRHKNVGWFPKVEGAHFVVEATITDTAAGQKETVTDSKGIFTSTPIVISFKRSLKDFKPGLASVVEADLNYVNGRPASDIKTILSGHANNNLPLRIYTNESISNKEGRVLFEIHPELHHDIVKVSVKTSDPKLGNNQAVGHHQQKKFNSRNKAYIAITRRGREIMQPGSYFAEDIFIENGHGNKPISDIYFLVTSKGKIVLMEKLPSGQFRNPRVEFKITHEMVPSFRVLVFGHSNNELIADSRKIDVAKECNPGAAVTVETDFLTKEPGTNGKIVLKGIKDTEVVLLGVDSGVYALSDQGLLTKSKMFKALEGHDLGCGPGGGWTTGGVLANAGLVMLTSHYSPEAQAESSCKENVRRKRELYKEKLDDYQGILRECCSLGLKNDLYYRTCEERTDIVINFLKENDKNCSTAFRDCCLYSAHGSVSNIKKGRIGGVVPTVRKLDDHANLEVISEEDEYMWESGTDVRQNFRETWFFSNFIIGPTGHKEHILTLPHSITTWILQGVSLSTDSGMCVTAPKELRSMKKVFIQLNLPYSVIRNEQIEIKVTVFNYGGKKLSAVVYMYGVKNLCSGSQEGEKSERKRLIVDAHSAESVYFPVIPLKEGIYDIKVVALSPEGSDIVLKQLNVLPEGQPVERHITVVLDPTNQQKRKRRDTTTDSYSDSIDETQKLQVTAIKLRIPKEAVPGTETCVVSALGDQFGPTVETSLENPEKLLGGPSGCAEQNMVYFAPTLYTMRYLKATGHITAERETKGYDLIRKGYSHELNFRKDDGSFGAWINTPSSVWLTAFVTRVFCEANELVHIDKNVMCSGVAWLLKKQNLDGSFKEDNPVYHKDMMGGVNGKIPLTAYVLLTFEACHCDIDMSVPKAQAVDYLEGNLNAVKDPLPTAIIAYALALSNSDFKHRANQKLLSLGISDAESNTLHWGSGSSAAANIETTSYALLTQLQFNNMPISNSIVNWLNTQRYYSGQFQSTQDTIVALNALAEYAIKAKVPGINLVANITSSNDRTFFKSVQFDERNARILQEVKVDKLGGLIFVNTAGHGVGLLSVKLRYNVPTPPEKLCRFDVTVNTSAVKEERRAPGENFPIDPRNNDNFDLYPQDLIRGVKKKLDEPPEDVVYENDPRNRQQRSSRAVKMEQIKKIIGGNVNRNNSRYKRADKGENSAVMLNVNICVKYLGDHEVGMSIVDVGVFSGFVPIEEDLKKLQKNKNSFIDKYEIVGKGVIFYLGKISYTESHCFQFRIMQEYIVGNTQTSIIKVYDYYNPDQSCTVFYRPDNSSPMLRKICDNGICQCAEGGCPPKNALAGLKREELLLTACEDHDYVWKGKAKSNVQRKDGFLRIKFLVLEVLKEGIETADLVEGEVRTLLARDNCENAELISNQEYLIMGKDGQKYESEEGEIWYRYILDKSSKIQILFDVQRVKGSQRAFQRELAGLSRKLKEKGCEL